MARFSPDSTDRSQCRGCGELIFHERAPGSVRIIRAGLIAVLLGVVGFFARVDQNPERQVVVQALRDTGNADDSLLPHLSPLGWEHINLTGDYNAPTAAQSALAYDFFRFVR